MGDNWILSYDHHGYGICYMAVTNKEGDVQFREMRDCKDTLKINNYLLDIDDK